RLVLDFFGNESDIIVGTNEDFGVSDEGRDKPRRLVAHLSPRSRLDVSWAGGDGSGAGGSPLFSAQGEVAIDIDADQMRTRSSWMLRCIRGTTRAFQFQLSDEHELTELSVDDRPAEAGIERKAGTLTVPLGDVLRPGNARRVVLKTRRAFENVGAQRVSFT